MVTNLFFERTRVLRKNESPALAPIPNALQVILHPPDSVRQAFYFAMFAQ
jgi:hypothetical protein